MTTKTKEKAGAHDLIIGERVKTTRTAHGWSQERLAKALGITFQQVQKYERGTNRIAASRLWDIANCFGLPVGHFFPTKDVLEAEKVIALKVGSARELLIRTAAILNEIA